MRDRVRVSRLRMLVLLLVLVTPALAGCLRVHASINVSDNDQVSGEIVAAVKARDGNDQGPQFDENMGFSQKISVSPYNEDDYVGSRASFTNLTFAEVPQLATLSRDATGADISLRRAGNLVILEGRVDLTNVTDPGADVTFSVAFPSEVTSTNGDRIDTNTVEWRLKAGAVTTMSAQSRYTDPSTRSFAAAALWLGLAACLVTGMIGALAWRGRDRTSPRFAAAESSDDDLGAPR